MNMPVRRAHLLLALLLLIAHLALAKEPQTPKPEVANEREYQAYQHYVNGDLLELSGNIQGAAEQYRNALNLNPNLHEARFHLAQILYRLKDVEGGLTQALQLPVDNVDYLKLVAGLYNSKREPAKAKEYYLKAVALDTTDLNSMYALAQLYQRENQPDSSLLYLKRVSASAPPNSKTHQQLGEYYYQLGQIPQADSEFRHAIELDSTNIEAYAALALALEAQRDFQGSLLVYKALRSRGAENPLLSQKLVGLYYTLGHTDSALAAAQAAVSTFPNDVSLVKLLGNLYFVQKDYPKAESILTALTISYPEDVDLYLALGRISAAKKEYGEAENHFQKAISLNDTLADGWLSLAETYLAGGKLEQAQLTYEAFLGKTKDIVGTYIAIGLGYGRAKQFDQAEKYFHRALESKPQEPTILLALGNLHQQMGQTDSAQAYFTRVLDLEPGNATALNNLGYLWTDLDQNLEKSREMIDQALKQEPNNPAFLDSYGWSMYKLGRLSEAEKYLQRAKELLPSDPEVYHHLGDLYHKQGKLKPAKESWQKALELSPDNQKLKEKLGRFK